MSLIKKALLGLLFCAVYWWVWMMLQPKPELIRPINLNHGADVVTVGWSGELRAYRWHGNHYELMWVRR